MKYILIPLFKYLKSLLQFIIAILLTIIWGIPTLLVYIIYSTLITIWNGKITLYEFIDPYIANDDDSISCDLLWSKKSQTYKTYFHLIWNLSEKPIMVQIIQKINNKLNLN